MAGVRQKNFPQSPDVFPTHVDNAGEVIAANDVNQIQDAIVETQAEVIKTAADTAAEILAISQKLTPAEILAAIKQVDGPASGLDADTLDGLHAGTFLKTTNIIAGKYTGNDAESRFIRVGFTPRIVLVFRRDGITYSSGNTFGGLAFTGNNAVTLKGHVLIRIQNLGFSVYNNESAYEQASNRSGVTYHYFAIR